MTYIINYLMAYQAKTVVNYHIHQRNLIAVIVTEKTTVNPWVLCGHAATQQDSTRLGLLTLLNTIGAQLHRVVSVLQPHEQRVTAP